MEEMQYFYAHGTGHPISVNLFDDDGTVHSLGDFYRDKLYILNQIKGEVSDEFIFLLLLIAQFGHGGITNKHIGSLSDMTGISLEQLVRYNIINGGTISKKVINDQLMDSPVSINKSFELSLKKWHSITAIVDNLKMLRGQVASFYFNEIINKFNYLIEEEITPIELMEDISSDNYLKENKKIKTNIISLDPSEYFSENQLVLRKEISSVLPTLKFKSSNIVFDFAKHDLATLIVVTGIVQNKFPIKYISSNKEILSNADVCKYMNSLHEGLSPTVFKYCNYIPSAAKANAFVLEPTWMNSYPNFDNFSVNVSNDADLYLAPVKFFYTMNFHNQDLSSMSTIARRTMERLNKDVENKITTNRARQLLHLHHRRIYFTMGSSFENFRNYFFNIKELKKTFEMFEIAPNHYECAISWMVFDKTRHGQPQVP